MKRRKNKISIAMASYNGGRYIAEQLESYCRQTVLPDELVICDDCSKDNTCDIIEEFAKTAPFCVKLLKNEKNLGVMRNFEKALESCSGDVIFLSDQDDVWLENKIAEYMKVFETDDTVGVVFSGYIVVDRNLKPTGRSRFTGKEKSVIPSNHIEFAEFYLRQCFCVQGACSAVRKSILNKALPFPQSASHVLHDGWLHTVAFAVCKAKILLMPTILYRQHGENVLGFQGQQGFFVRAKSAVQEAKQRRLKELNWMNAALERYECLEFDDKESLISFLKTRICLLKKHVDLFDKPVLKRLFVVMLDLLRGNYHRYFLGYKTFVTDFLAMIYSFCLSH